MPLQADQLSISNLKGEFALGLSGYDLYVTEATENIEATYDLYDTESTENIEAAYDTYDREAT